MRSWGRWDIVWNPWSLAGEWVLEGDRASS